MHSSMITCCARLIYFTDGKCYVSIWRPIGTINIQTWDVPSFQMLNMTVQDHQEVPYTEQSGAISLCVAAARPSRSVAHQSQITMNRRELTITWLRGTGYVAYSAKNEDGKVYRAQSRLVNTVYKMHSIKHSPLWLIDDSLYEVYNANIVCQLPDPGRKII